MTGGDTYFNNKVQEGERETSGERVRETEMERRREETDRVEAKAERQK